MTWEKYFDLRPEICQRVGRRVLTRAFEYQCMAGSRLRDGQRPFGLVLAWPRNGYLDVKAYFAPVDPATKLLRKDQQSAFAVGAAAQPILTKWQIQLQDAQLGDANMNVLAAAELPGNRAVVLEITVNTDSIDFCQEAEEALKAGAGRNLEGVGFIDTIKLLSRDGAFHEEGEILLEYQPNYPEPYDGYLGLDLGNTSSTLAVIDVNADDPNQAELIDANNELGRAAPDSLAVDSCLRLEHYDPRVSFDSPDCAVWLIGERSRIKGGIDGLILGLKRQVASRAWRNLTTVMVHNYLPGHGSGPPREQKIHAYWPAELFVCRLLQAFAQARYALPQHLAVTYPTTFNSRELKQLRETVYRGWLRAHAYDQPQSVEEDPGALDRVTPLLLDEASAAAFYFLYRKVYLAPHGLARFEYLYPQGFNLVLYDCGGGTTDIALVSADIVREQEGPVLRVRVRGRSGSRDFGGDNITREIFRLLKARLALICARRQRRVLPEWPLEEDGSPKAGGDAAATIRSYLDANLQSFDEFVPTYFFDRRHIHGDLEVNSRRMLTMFLWYEAERLKEQFGPEKREAAFEIETGAPLHSFLRHQYGDKAEDICVDAAKIVVKCQELDLLVGPQILRSVKKCNHLIYQRLTSQGEDVHWVVVAGNASRFPTIQQTLRDELDVLFLGERFEFEHDSLDLKNAVAKGAALALRKKFVRGRVPVKFETEIRDKLPFDVGVGDERMRVFTELFREDQTYKECSERKKLELQASQATGNAVLLYRHWPGEKDEQRKDIWEPYLKYHFDQGIPAELSLLYDEGEAEFVLEDRQRNVTRPSDAGAADKHLAPMQSGHL